jgi:hypothetical protein
MRVVGSNQHAILAELFERELEQPLVRFTGHVAVLLDVLGRLARDLRREAVVHPLVVVVHAVHPIEDPLRAALEEGDAQIRIALEHPTGDEPDEPRRTVERPSQNVHREEIVVAVDQLAKARGMQHQRHVELRRLGIERLERR